MSSQSSAPRRRLEPDARKAEILAAARRLFGTGTYTSVSTTDLAEAAGVARGLINHYFGGKRGLYLEVVRQMMVIPAPVTQNLPNTTVEQRVAIGMDRWLDVVERNEEMWLTAIGPEAIGREEDVEAILLEGDETATDRVLEAAMMSDVTEGRDMLRALIRAYGSMLRSASREWLVRGALSRSDLHVILTDVMLHILNSTFPKALQARQTDAS